MTCVKPAIKTSAIVMAILVYTFLTNLPDIKKGLLDGWATAQTSRVK